MNGAVAIDGARNRPHVQEDHTDLGSAPARPFSAASGKVWYTQRVSKPDDGLLFFIAQIPYRTTGWAARWYRFRFQSMS